MAFITVSDAAGRVLFRRRATEVEIDEARRAAEEADAGAEAAMHEIAQQRYAALAAGTTIEQHFAPPQELADAEELEQYGGAESEFEDEPVVMAQAEHEPGLFDEEDAADDSWFGDARFMEEEEVAS